MTRAEFAKGSATFLVVIVAGLLSETYLDRHLAAAETDKKAASNDTTVNKQAITDMIMHVFNPNGFPFSSLSKPIPIPEIAAKVSLRRTS